MKRALVLFHSRRGTTASYGQEIEGELLQNGVEATAIPLYSAETVDTTEADTLFFNQHPEKDFISYVQKLPDLGDKKVVLFTTYKILTGSMFRMMSKYLPGNPEVSHIKMRSRSGRLSNDDRGRLLFLSSI
jgi:hypothetical protein